MARILVGLSGGVDSAVAAHLLIQQGHEVIAGFMKNYAEPTNPNCHTREDRNMALRVAAHLGIDTFVIFDFRKHYQERIIDYIYDSYQAGITPNPDVLCNSLIKFDLFRQRALALGCDAIATGHYAQTQDNKLLRGIDHNKDQSYFLSQLTAEQLTQSHFPIGHLTKPQVRQIAHDIDLPNADRPDSQGLCFIGDIPIADFLSKKFPPQPGDVLDSDGKVVGTHKSALYYTIGQRHGFHTNDKHYVIETDIPKNTITVTNNKEDPLLYTTSFDTKKRHWITQPDTLPTQAQIKIRYRQKDPAPATLTPDLNEPTRMHITTTQPLRAVASGQFAVAYQDDMVLGAGTIDNIQH